MGKMVGEREAPSLVKLCIETAIANLRYLGAVGGVGEHLLQEILPHCTADQLMHIEKLSEDSDLSSVTNDLWKRFYRQQFGEDSEKLVIRRMEKNKVFFKWRHLYEAKSKERQLFQNKSAERLKQRYEEEYAKRQSKQIQISSKIPPSKCKRSFKSVGGSAYNVSHIKGNLMKKAKLECLRSPETMIHAAMRKRTAQKNSLPLQSVPRSSKPSSFLGRRPESKSKLSCSFTSSASSAKLSKISASSASTTKLSDSITSSTSSTKPSKFSANSASTTKLSNSFTSSTSTARLPRR